MRLVVLHHKGRIFLTGEFSRKINNNKERNKQIYYTNAPMKIFLLFYFSVKCSVMKMKLTWMVTSK